MEEEYMSFVGPAMVLHIQAGAGADNVDVDAGVDAHAD